MDTITKYHIQVRGWSACVQSDDQEGKINNIHLNPGLLAIYSSNIFEHAIHPLWYTAGRKRNRTHICILLKICHSARVLYICSTSNNNNNNDDDARLFNMHWHWTGVLRS
jgi:hypothetical protein